MRYWSANKEAGCSLDTPNRTDAKKARAERFRQFTQAAGKVLGRLAYRLSRVRSPLDVRDVGQLAGLGLIFWGLWLREPWLAPLVTGACLYLTHLFGDFSSRSR